MFRQGDCYCHSELKISPTVEMTSACHSDQWDDCMDRYIAPCNICIHHFHVDYAGGTTPRTGEVELRQERQSRAMHGAIAEESYKVAESKISPVVEMTSACHFDQREKSCLVAEEKISPIVETERTSACHFDQREKPCIMTFKEQTRQNWN